jgi:hypothetical protein
MRYRTRAQRNFLLYFLPGRRLQYEPTNCVGVKHTKPKSSPRLSAPASSEKTCGWGKGGFRTAGIGFSQDYRTLEGISIEVCSARTVNGKQRRISKAVVANYAFTLVLSHGVVADIMKRK